ncbi:LOW QUALITY PROTEIN: hypothetical protein CVT25_001795, partial [Psilocybe cyanescens]
LDVNDQKAVVISTKIKHSVSGLRWEWTSGNEILFAPSSKIEIMIYRCHKLKSDKCIGMLGQTQVVDMIANDASFDLTNENGLVVPLKMKIALSPAPKSEDDIENLLKEVDNSASKLIKREGVLSTASSIGQVLQSIKAIVDNFSQVHPVLNASWVVVSGVYKILQETDVQDEVIQELANMLCEMLGTAAAVPDLPQIPSTDSVIDEISQQSLQVALLIHEYMKLSFLICMTPKDCLFAEWTAKIQLSDDLKSHILQCQTKCASLQDRLALRIGIDTHAQTKQIGQNMGVIIQTLNIIKDDALATKICKWLSALDSSRNLNEADEKHQDGTCLWFLESEQFLRWQETSELLWIKGKFLQSQKHFLKRNHIFSLTTIVVYLELWKICTNTVVIIISLQLLQKILQDILDQFSHAYIIIDALDECTDRAKTLDWISRLVENSNQSVTNIHILVTSQPEQDIKNKFNQLSLAVIDIAEATRQDIVDVLNVQMDLKFKKYSQESQHEIKTQLNKRVDGSYVLFYLSMDGFTTPGAGK